MPDNAPLSIAFNVPFHEAIAQMQRRGVVLPDVYYGKLQGIARQKAFSIAGITSLDQLTAVSDSLKEYMAKGGSFNKWKKEQAVLDLSLPKHRLDNIWRTNLQGQYMAGKWENFKEFKSSRPYLMYDAINDSRVRPAHLALDGIIRPVGDAFWASHSPPCGYRCRCSLISLNDKQARDRSVNGKGLNQQPILENGLPALPDKGWDYDKTNRMAGVEKAIAEKLEKASPALKKSFTEWMAKKMQSITEWMAKKMQFLADSVFGSKITPVSKVLILPKAGFVKTVSETVLAEIDRIHSVGVLPQIPVLLTDSKIHGGTYRAAKNIGDIHIAISQYATDPEFDFTHEMGHFLDHQAIGGTGTFASESSDLMAGWRNIVTNSTAIKEISALPKDTQFRDYYLGTTEIWARCYAQYIAIKSDNSLLIEQLNAIRTGQFDKPIHRLSQWNDKDFEPIASEIDNLFLMLGWENDK